MPDFKTIQLRPMTGIFDALSSPDEVGYGNFRLVKNATTRSTRNRQRGGGWRRLFADDSPYNNQDLHDQLVDRLSYYGSYVGHAMGGGGLSGYGYPYFSGSYQVPGFSTFPPAEGPYCPVYIGDFPGGLYGGCPIFYPFVGYPYDFIGGNVDATHLFSHWRMDEMPVNDVINGVSLITNGTPVVEEGRVGSSIAFHAGGSDDYLSRSDAILYSVNIKFGFCGWVYRFNSGASDEGVFGVWAGGGANVYRLMISGGQLRFDVSSDGTSAVSVTHGHVLPVNTWTFFAAWHDPVSDTINIKVNNMAIASTPHSSGIWVPGSTTFTVGKVQLGGVGVFDGRIDSLSFWRNGFPTEPELESIYAGGAGDDYPFAMSTGETCDTGYPFYYLHSYVYTSCPTITPPEIVPGYPYGSAFPIYDPLFSYDYVYCGEDLWFRPGCREAVTMLNEISTDNGRKLIAATMSRVYELNQSSGNWRILADGLGSAGYTAEQCGCNRVRGVSDTMGGYFLYTNNFDPPMSYFVGDESSGCSLSALLAIPDLDALGISRAGGVVVWKGFAIWFDLTENGTRHGGDVIWSDLEDPLSYIEGDTSFAGRATIAVGETILAAAELGNWLMLYTDRGIIRATLVGGDDVFNFERIYTGGNAIKYKFSLVNAGDFHFYVGESDAYLFTQFDTRPINVAWVTKACGIVFNGMSEDDAAYGAINKEACDLVTGGWSEEKREVWLSWPTGDNICPNVTLRFNFKFNTADLVDHGFTSFLTFRNDNRPTVGWWIEDMGICPMGSKVATGPKDGPACPQSGVAASNPPLYIRNPTENPDLPIHPDSLCARLGNKSMDSFCQDCPSPSTFITASAEDFTLKQQEDEIYYREMLGGSAGDYDGYSCQGDYYTFEGYDTVIQEGSESYRNSDEKMIKRVIVEAQPLPQSSPSQIECDVAYGSQPSCMTWVSARPLEFECQTQKTTAQHGADRTRPDDGFNFPVWRRGIYLSTRFRISGIGGGGTFSALNKSILGWGQADSP